ncbi:hypothetical protein AAA799P11_00171 [Marine Group I thaumarchaeote SCGC AAA799-P11]|uniref:N-acetyltransferase domain-containing protein n=1 Tax=Marine Group I thaumarchaeote SCGC AAA799-P11 TaxID=1502295 RepID=A0A087S2Z6_9ARCH|nr:hypothetical protein AAA799P11_00171 [Marine Group I thaumarchaeote SCGC AAA799-P11]
MKQSNKYSLKIVTKNDFEFLFELLKERKQYENISHKNLPTYKNHVKFVNSKPYSKWYIIFQNEDRVGSVYLTQINEIGMHIKNNTDIDEIFKEIISEVIKKNPRKRYLINLNPKNHKLVKNLKRNDFKLIQHTYELTSFKKFK